MHHYPLPYHGNFSSLYLFLFRDQLDNKELKKRIEKDPAPVFLQFVRILLGFSLFL